MGSDSSEVQSISVQLTINGYNFNLQLLYTLSSDKLVDGN